MMRERLKKLNGQRIQVRGTVNGFGTKTYKNHESRTICIKDIYHTKDSRYLCDHLWFTVGKIWSQLNLKVGDEIEFEGTVSSYKKGYKNPRKFIDNRTNDYKLKNPTKIRVLSSR